MERLLIVDDEPGIRMLLKDYFEMTGYETWTAENGREAVELAKKQPDLILLDINLPDLDGMSVCRKIREEVRCPILFLTAKIEEQDKINGLLSGGDDYHGPSAEREAGQTKQKGERGDERVPDSLR